VEHFGSDKLKELSHHRKHKKVKEIFVKKVSSYNKQKNYKGTYKNELITKILNRWHLAYVSATVKYTI